MRIALRKIYIGVTIIGVAAISIAAICYVVGVRINTTKSIPVGIYLTTDSPIEKGEYVLFCPPDVSVFAIAKKRDYITGGFCPGDYGYMMKKILAAKGDEVMVTDKGVIVDGKLLPHSQPVEVDLAGRELPRYQSNKYTLGNSEVLLMSDVSNTSFDARYFGPINRSQIKSVIRPIIVW